MGSRIEPYLFWNNINEKYLFYYSNEFYLEWSEYSFFYKSHKK